MGDDDEKSYEDILDMVGKDLRILVYSALIWILQLRNGSNSLNQCGQKVMNVVDELMLKIPYAKRI